MHRLNITAGKANITYIGATQIITLPERATEYLSEYVTGMHSRSEAQGRAQSAWWIDGTIPSHLDRLMTCATDEFEEESKASARELARQAPGNAQPGLVVFVRVTST